MANPASPSRVVELACLAPSIHNTQPWRWTTDDASIELYADQTRRLPATDPEGRSLVISCGAALHHALVAARALGWQPAVIRLPDGPDSDLFARISLRPAAADAAALGRLDALRRRCTDRRRFTSWPIAAEQVQLLAATAAVSGASAHVVTLNADRVQVDLLVSRAFDRQQLDPALAQEQPAGLESRAIDHIAGSDGIVVLGGAADDVPSWLATGEGLSALWLDATTQGISVVPLSQIVEVEETRLALRYGVLRDTALPHLLLRLGWQPIGRGTLTRTLRRRLGDVLDVRPPAVAQALP